MRNTMTEHPYNLLTDYFLTQYHIDVSVPREIEIVPARSLICANRFDLMAKWIYIYSKETGMNMSWATDIYRDNINSFSCGSFTEPGSPQKNTFKRYKDDFDVLIEEIKHEGFDVEKSVVPVGANGTIFDGSHRVAIAAYYNKQIGIVRFDDVKPYNTYDYQYFRKNLMSDTNMGYMAAQYAKLREHIFFVCIWPAANASMICQAEEILRQNGEIIYGREVYLTHNGIRNLMIQTYGHQSWTGSPEDNYAGVDAKVKLCYRKGIPVRTYLMEVESIEKVLSVKEVIRDLYKIDNHSIHISDNDDETRSLTELMYNPNSVMFLNFAKPFNYKMVYRQVSELKTRIQDNHLDIDRFIVDSSGVLEACGIRAARDFDYLTDYSEAEMDKVFCDWNTNMGEIPSNHKDQLQYHAIAVRDMLYNPENYFCYHGMKFLSLNRLSDMKKCRGEKKDIVDAKLCADFMLREREIPIEFRKSTYEKVHRYQVGAKEYGKGPLTYKEYRYERLVWAGRRYIGIPAKGILKRFVISGSKIIAERRRQHWLHMQRERLKNKDMSIVASNCNAGVFLSDMEIEFRSPFVNLFIKASDYIKMLSDLKGYLKEELMFVTERDPVYGNLSYPTAYLRDVKIYFMHFASESEARDAWNRRAKRINWDNLFIMFTDRSGCTQKDLEDFDSLPYQNKVVFTHVPHPEIKSSFYIKGYENENKVGVLSDFENDRFPVKRIYDQFDMVGWLNKVVE